MRKKKIETKFKTTYLLIIFGAIIIFTMPLAHKLFPQKNQIVENYKKELKKQVNHIEEQIRSSRLKYGQGLITAENYIVVNESLIKKKLDLKLKNKKLIDLKVDQERFLGWKTVRGLLVGLGVRLPFLFFSIILSFLISKINIEDKYFRKSLFFLQVSCYGLSFYFLFWVFWTSPDFPITVYRWFFILFSISAAAFTVYFISYKNIFKTNLEFKLKGIIAYVLEVRNKHFYKMALNSLEVDEEGTIQVINQFEERTIEELEKITEK